MLFKPVLPSMKPLRPFYLRLEARIQSDPAALRALLRAARMNVLTKNNKETEHLMIRGRSGASCISQ